MRRMTSIVLKGKPLYELGFSYEGRKTRAEMIDRLRKEAAFIKVECNRVLNAKESDFLVETYVGVREKKHLEEVRDVCQCGRPIVSVDTYDHGDKSGPVLGCQFCGTT